MSIKKSFNLYCNDSVLKVNSKVILKVENMDLYVYKNQLIQSSTKPNFDSGFAFTISCPGKNNGANIKTGDQIKLYNNDSKLFLATTLNVVTLGSITFGATNTDQFFISSEDLPSGSDIKTDTVVFLSQKGLIFTANVDIKGIQEIQKAKDNARGLCMESYGWDFEGAVMRNKGQDPCLNAGSNIQVPNYLYLGQDFDDGHRTPNHPFMYVSVWDYWKQNPHRCERIFGMTRDRCCESRCGLAKRDRNYFYGGPNNCMAWRFQPPPGYICPGDLVIMRNQDETGIDKYNYEIQENYEGKIMLVFIK